MNICLVGLSCKSNGKAPDTHYKSRQRTSIIIIPYVDTLNFIDFNHYNGYLIFPVKMTIMSSPSTIRKSGIVYSVQGGKLQNIRL